MLYDYFKAKADERGLKQNVDEEPNQMLNRKWMRGLERSFDIEKEKKAKKKCVCTYVGSWNLIHVVDNSNDQSSLLCGQADS